MYLPLLLLLLTRTSDQRASNGNDEGDSLLVETTTGALRGVRQRAFTGQEVDMFWGIPYAEPPVGELRFRAPVPIKK